MLAVLFLGARLRALELSHWRGDPQAWVQTAFQVTESAGLFFQPFLQC